MTSPRVRPGALARPILLALTLTASLIVGPQPDAARASTYTVTACDAATGFVNNSWAAGRSNDFAAAYTVCPNDDSGHRGGLRAFSDFNRGVAPWLTLAWMRFDAPAGTELVSADLAYTGYARSGSGRWDARIQADDSRNLDGCFVGNPCYGFGGGATHHFDLNGHRSVRAIIGCYDIDGCSTSDTGEWPWAPAHVTIHNAAVTLRDLEDPRISDVGGSAIAGGWRRGMVDFGFRASDNTGISRTRMRADESGPSEESHHACDYSDERPCGDRGSRYELNTRSLSDGRHEVLAEAWDAAGRYGHGGWRELLVDNHAPGRISRPRLGVGENWQTVASTQKLWENPDGQHAPLTAAHVRICKVGGECAQHTESFRDYRDRIDVSAFAGPGEYRVTTWLEDAAGNHDEDRASEPVTLRFDNVPPGPAAPAYSNGWLNKAEAEAYDQHITLRDDATKPVSGIAGYSLTTDGATPDAAIEAVGEEVQYPLRGLPEGRNIIRARAVSGAGLASPDTQDAEVLVDKTAPTAQVSGIPSAEWSRGAVALEVAGEDQPGLSGMGAALPPKPTEEGAYIAYRVDGGPESRVPGHRAAVTIEEEGRHTLTFRAVDLAGNESPEQTATFKIDGTAPDPVAFEEQSLPDPTTITVAASDPLSGLADGEIQMRRVGPIDSAGALEGSGPWTSLETRLDRDRYLAKVPWRAVDAGLYEFRASVPDRAGNETVARSFRNGQPVRYVIIPGERFGEYVRLEDGTWIRLEDHRRESSSVTDVFSGDDVGTVATRVDVALVRRVKRAKSSSRARRCRRLAAPRARRQCVRRNTAYVEQLGSSARVGFGRTAEARGKLETHGGAPIAGASVDVYATPDHVGAIAQKVDSVQTNADGQFRYTTRPGPSRRLTFAFDDGPGDYRRSSNHVELKVRGAARLRVSKRAVRNGQRVMFSGAVLGRPIPARGKVVDLQAFYRGKWRTFGTPRARGNGKFRFKYRFGATLGRVTYRFRARVRAEGAYPYELGYSRVVRVTVTG